MNAAVTSQVIAGVVYITRSTHDVKLELYKLRKFLVKVLLGTLGITMLLTLILATTIVVWALSYFPRSAEVALPLCELALHLPPMGERPDWPRQHTVVGTFLEEFPAIEKLQFGSG